MTESNRASQNEELVHWIRLAQDGDHQAFEQVYHRTQALARQVAFSVVSQNLVDDAVQESYLLAYRKLKQLKAPEAFLAWLCRLVLHTSQRISKKNKPFLELAEGLTAGTEQTEQALDSLALRQALTRLPQRDRDVLITRDLLEFSYSEVAYILKIPITTVRSRLHKARKKLAHSLKL